MENEFKDKIIINTISFNKAKQEIEKRRKEKKMLIIIGKSDLFNRKILEKTQNIVLLLNQKQKKDRAKQRESGLNHVMAKFAKQNNHQIGINLDEIFQSKAEQQAMIISRIMQNIKLCNKKKVKMKFISLKSNKLNNFNLKSLGLSLGMPTSMAKWAAEN